MSFGAIIGGALSGISNLFGARSQNQSVDKQLAAAREESEKTRKWQTSEREAQNDWNYKLWQLHTSGQECRQGHHVQEVRQASEYKYKCGYSKHELQLVS
jgi:hypothetical protein